MLPPAMLPHQAAFLELLLRFEVLRFADTQPHTVSDPFGVKRLP